MRSSGGLNKNSLNSLSFFKPFLSFFLKWIIFFLSKLIMLNLISVTSDSQVNYYDELHVSEVEVVWDIRLFAAIPNTLKLVQETRFVSFLSFTFSKYKV